MLNSKKISVKKRVISVEKSRLTLSGSKISISSLSNSLIKFYEAQPSYNPGTPQRVQFQRNRKARSAYSLNLNHQLGQNKKKDMEFKAQRYRNNQQNPVNEYGILIPNYKKLPYCKWQVAKYANPKITKLQIKNSSLFPSQDKENQSKNRLSPYLNFTFGSDGLKQR